MVIVTAVVVAVALWWSATLLALYRTQLPESSYRRTFFGASLLGNIGVAVVIVSSFVSTPLAACASFAGGLAIWSWHELSYLLGFVSGPRPHACPPSASTWQRLRHGISACLYHELALILTVAVLAAVLWDAANQVGLWTFVLLWVMRWSTKLNIFLGVRNLHTEFWPARLQYLVSYTRERHMNPLFPISISVILAGFLYLVMGALQAPMPFATTSAALLATLLFLGALEHLFLMLPIADERLWRMALGSPRRAGPG